MNICRFIKLFRIVKGTHLIQALFVGSSSRAKIRITSFLSPIIFFQKRFVKLALSDWAVLAFQSLNGLTLQRSTVYVERFLNYGKIYFSK